jgi:hypothetical protein
MYIKYNLKAYSCSFILKFRVQLKKMVGLTGNKCVHVGNKVQVSKYPPQDWAV